MLRRCGSATCASCRTRRSLPSPLLSSSLFPLPLLFSSLFPLFRPRHFLSSFLLSLPFPFSLLPCAGLPGRHVVTVQQPRPRFDEPQNHSADSFSHAPSHPSKRNPCGTDSFSHAPSHPSKRNPCQPIETKPAMPAQSRVFQAYRNVTKQTERRRKYRLAHTHTVHDLKQSARQKHTREKFNPP